MAIKRKAARTNQEYSAHPFKLSIEQLANDLETNLEAGLSSAQVQSLQSKYGQNKLDGEGAVRWYSVLLRQISNAMILVLVLAMALSYGVSDYIEGGVITAVILLNVFIGFYQEFRAEQKMDSLRSLSSPSAAVLRNGGVEDTVPSAEVVPGDIVMLRTGDTVPADLRLFDVMNLECDEKILTGEALPVAKDVEIDFGEANELETGVGDRINMAYSSASVTKGRGRGIVTFTGMSTEIGKIAESMQGKKRKANRSLSRKEGNNLQPVKGLGLRIWDGAGKFLGLTSGTPLQRKLSKLAYVLLLCALILAIIVFGVNTFNVTKEVAIYAISTGIAIIPESLIAVLTITMVVGMTQMRKRKVVVRQLSALEALGGITNICSDKTGTLTQGQMIARKAWIPNVGIYGVKDAAEVANPNSGSVTLQRAPTSKIESEQELEQKRAEQDRKRSVAAVKFDISPGQPESRNAEDLNEKVEDEIHEHNPELGRNLEAFLQSAALCNLSTVRYSDEKNAWQTTGDPTEIALQVFAQRFDQGKKALGEKGWKQVAEYPFDSSVKQMSVIYRNSELNENFIFTKGAVERVLDLCINVGLGEEAVPMTDEQKNSILDQMSMLADQGLRVLAVARRTLKGGVDEERSLPRDVVEKDLTLLGLAGLYDPPRLETKDAVKECSTAGVRVHMLTGDHPGTAFAIAKEVGIVPRNVGALPHDVASSLVQTASHFDGKTDAEIDEMPELPLVIARCAPETKTRMIGALHRRKAFCAMTGDGVNDAPSLKAADVGIAMGMGGSDVAKGASDIVLTDDNFASIVNAIEEGRRMFDNIQKFILHLLTSNVGEVVLLIAGLGFQDQSGFSVFPLSPLQILWINMLTSSFPAFGLGREKPSPDIMRRPPHDNKKGVFTSQILVDMGVYGLLMGICTLLTFVIIVYGPGGGNLGENCNREYSEGCNTVFRARAAVFAELTWLILISAWEFKSIRRSMFNLDPNTAAQHKFPFFYDIYENRFLFFAVVLGAISVFPAVYIPGLNTAVFKHMGIGWEWALSFGAIFIFVLGIEAWKFTKRRTGWFDDGVRYEKSEEHKLSLRQGFFSFAKTLSRSSSDNGNTSRSSVSKVPMKDEGMV
ncbi:MAG: Na+ ATPase [Sclerophora amabilis]|nr:MAG: Na+ ATPase [Sclerophora amabilis]